MIDLFARATARQRIAMVFWGLNGLAVLAAVGFACRGWA